MIPIHKFRVAIIGISALLQACSTTQPRTQSSNDTAVSAAGRSFLVIASDGAQLYVREFGAAASDQVLLVVPGGPGISHEYVLPMRQLAHHSLRVVFFDPRGVGRSSVPSLSRARSETWSLKKHADDIEAIRTRLGVRRLSLAAFSWGALVATAYASSYDKNVSSLILVSPAAPHRCIQAQATRHFDEAVQNLEAQGKLRRGTLDQVRNCGDALQLLAPAYFFDDRKALEQSGAPIACNDEVSRAVWDSFGDYDLLPAIRKLTAPILVVQGRGDSYGDAGVAAFVANAERAPASYAMLDRCGHRVLQECPGALTRHVAAFLTETASGKRRLDRSSSALFAKTSVPECPEREELMNKLLDQ